jgi:hypothetical protein
MSPIFNGFLGRSPCWLRLVYTPVMELFQPTMRKRPEGCGGEPSWRRPPSFLRRPSAQCPPGARARPRSGPAVTVPCSRSGEGPAAEELFLAEGRRNASAPEAGRGHSSAGVPGPEGLRGGRGSWPGGLAPGSGASLAGGFREGRGQAGWAVQASGLSGEAALGPGG